MTSGLYDQRVHGGLPIEKPKNAFHRVAENRAPTSQRGVIIMTESKEPCGDKGVINPVDKDHTVIVVVTVVCMSRISTVVVIQSSRTSGITTILLSGKSPWTTVALSQSFSQSFS